MTHLTVEIFKIKVGMEMTFASVGHWTNLSAARWTYEPLIQKLAIKKD